MSMFQLGRSLSSNAKRALLKGIVIGVIVTALYITIVVVTTPNLPPATAIATAFTINLLIIGGTATVVGAQVAMTSYSESLGCSLRGRKGLVGAAPFSCWHVGVCRVDTIFNTTFLCGPCHSRRFHCSDGGKVAKRAQTQAEQYLKVQGGKPLDLALHSFA
jgi:hypothetical protein